MTKEQLEKLLLWLLIIIAFVFLVTKLWKFFVIVFLLVIAYEVYLVLQKDAKKDKKGKKIKEAEYKEKK